MHRTTRFQQMGVTSFGDLYDMARRRLGGLLPLLSNFNDILIDRDDVPAALSGSHASLPATPAALDRWAEQGWFAWQPLPGTESRRYGVPMHTLQRVAFLNELSSQGWTDPELAAYADFEEQFTELVLVGDTIPFPQPEDDGRVAAVALLQRELDILDDEIGARRPVEQWPKAWHWKRRSSELMILEDEELARQRDELGWLVEHVQTKWGTMDTAAAETLRREAFTSAMHDETMNHLMLERERLPMRAGVSWFVVFASTCPRHYQVTDVPTPEVWLEEFKEEFEPDWESVVQHPWCDDAGNEFPIRLPGITIIDGQFLLTGPSHPTGFADLYRRWNLGRYKELRAAVAGERICAHCHVPIDGPPRKRFCSSECNHAARQAQLRRRQQDLDPGSTPHGTV